MPGRLHAAIVILWLGTAGVAAQEHAPAKPAAEPVIAAPPAPVASKQHFNVTPTVPPAKVAAAVAEAIRAAEAAEARRAARASASARPAPVRRAPVAAGPVRHYEVRWPVQRMVVRWPETASDRVTLAWPESF